VKPLICTKTVVTCKNVIDSNGMKNYFWPDERQNSKPQSQDSIFFISSITKVLEM
jgi:hypothetical protein